MRSLPAFAFAALSFGACRAETRDDDSATARSDSAAPVAAPARVVATSGFSTPESVLYDEASDMYFVSNINGNPSQKDGNGFISRLRGEDGGIDSLRFIAGGRDGVTLNAPKGMALAGDTLWVADIDVLRAFDRTTGRPIATVAFSAPRAEFLNDVAVGPDGIYVTDTGIRFAADGAMSHPGTDRIFRVAGRTVSVAVEGDALGRPNGIAWDRARDRFVLAPFGAPVVSTWAPGDSLPARMASGPGRYDGLAVTSDGRVLVSSWADSSVHVVEGETMRRLVTQMPSPADFGYDARRNRITIPLFNGNRVEIWTIGG